MDSNVISDLPLPTTVPLDPTANVNRAVDDQVEAAGGGKEIEINHKMVSFVALLEKHGCLKRFDRQYVISLTASKAWEPLFEYTQSVGSFEFDQDAVLETAQISPSVFVYLAQQLKGKPLFPNLSTIQLVGLDTFAHYLPLLGSPFLKDITLELVLGQATLEFTLYTFLQHLASASPDLRSLKLKNVTARRLLNPIMKFQHLHALEIISFTNVRNFEELHALGTLASLEHLSLKVEDLTYTRSTQPASSDVFLPSLRKLCIDAPSDVVSDLLLVITSEYLENFTFHPTSTSVTNFQQPDPSQPKLPKLKRGKQKKKSDSPSFGNPTADDTAQEKIHFSEKDKVDFLDNLSSRWPRQLKKVVIASSIDFKCDLRDLARLQALRSLKFKGPLIVSVQETFDGPYGFRNSLQSLHLSGFHVSLPLLRTIALSTPFLRKMTISIDIDERPPASNISAIIHPLQSLTVDRRRNEVISIDSDSVSEFHHEIDLSQLILMARYLNAFFPDIQNLTASVRAPEWGEVWKLLKFCQVSRDDEKGRKSIGENSDVS